MHVVAYIARRCVRSVLLLTGVSVLSFALVELAPGDYFDEIRLNASVSAQTIEALRTEFGFNEPVAVRYVSWCRSVLKGEWGFSLAYRRAAGPLLWERAGNTLLLTTVATILAWFTALAAVVWAAAGKSWRQKTIAGVAALLIALPDLVIVLGLILVAVRTHWLPAGGMTVTDHASMSLPQRTADLAWHMILPVAALTASLLPAVLLHSRAALTQVLGAPFILSARASGIPRFRLLLRHAMPVASNPLITLAGFSVGALLNSALVVEAVTGWPGLGNLLLQSVLQHDLYVVAGALMLSAALLLTGNLFSDLWLFAADPRIRRPG